MSILSMNTEKQILRAETKSEGRNQDQEIQKNKIKGEKERKINRKMKEYKFAVAPPFYEKGGCT